jgi:predicted RecA/RadA family phage recombinase
VLTEISDGVLTKILFDQPKLASAMIAAGAKVSWGATAKQINVPATGRFPVGIAIEAAGNSAATVRDRLEGVSTAAA